MVYKQNVKWTLNLTYVHPIWLCFAVKLNLEILVHIFIFVLKFSNYATHSLLTNWLKFLVDFSDLTLSLDCFPYSALFHGLWLCPPNVMKPLGHYYGTSNGCYWLFHSEWFFVYDYFMQAYICTLAGVDVFPCKVILLSGRVSLIVFAYIKNWSI